MAAAVVCNLETKRTFRGSKAVCDKKRFIFFRYPGRVVLMLQTITIGNRFNAVILTSVAVKLAENSSASSRAAANVGRFISRSRGSTMKGGRNKSDAKSSAWRSGFKASFAKLQTSFLP